ncbi:PD-(D/E)XK nuclease-like domain-containing protein [Sulfitobacter dubius]|uniref:PD-(D/E)XK nuclease-like domain-containing protein n=1 Tax=Sulfitobacter dubius TaxID=218673 RepID=UPI0022AFBFF1|nr:PD-(D/E)XK nuclease-like domain-containing protein [Sulfitobacter dubius]MCZ4366651.1 PD-(D/E)XK nuclease-like domain-containing protein [Sulfitobacter dubius]
MKHNEVDMENAEPVEAKVGVFPGISNADYHGGPGISKSGLDKFKSSAAHFKQSMEDGYTAPTPSQRLGTLAHSFILEHDTFWDYYALPFQAPEGALSTNDDLKARLSELGEKATGTKPVLIERLRAVDPSAVIFDDAKAAYAAEVGDREIITHDELEKLEGMRASILAHPKASKLLAPGSGVAELSCYWIDPETGVQCRCRPDWWRFDGTIVDLKTCRDASPAGFEKSVWDWGYYKQDPFYQDGSNVAVEQGENPLNMPAPKAFVFVAIETVKPHACTVFLLRPESRELGRRDCRTAMNTYAECLRTDEWPAYSEEIELVGVPEWVLRREAFEHAEEGVYVA